MSIQLLQLAWRNLWRNPRRTVITMTAIAFGYAMLMFVACLMAGLRWQMVENGTRLVLSQIQVHAPGYYPNRSIQKTIGGGKGTDVNALLAAITADSRVYAAAPRVYGYGLVNSGHRSAGVELMGVVPDQEPEDNCSAYSDSEGQLPERAGADGRGRWRQTREHYWRPVGIADRSIDAGGRRFDGQ